MLTIKIEEDTAVELLLERLKVWTDDETTHKLYESMYGSYVYSGCFDGCEFDVMQIVDNDYVNWCDVICEGEAAYEGIKKLYDSEGLGDISCEHELNGGYSLIEAEYNGCFLVRS
jgi:hypothetical protein